MEKFFQGIADIFDSVVISSQLKQGGKIMNALLIKTTGTELTIVNALYELFKPVALYMVLIYGLMELVDILQKENATFEQLLKFFIKISCTIVLINFGAGIISSIAGYGNYLVQNAGTFGIVPGGSANDDITNAMQSIYDGKGFLKGMFLFLMSLITGFIGKISGAVILVMLYARKVEMFMRLAFTSIAFANVYGELVRSDAIRYLKKLLALSLQGIGIAGALSIIGQIQTAELQTILAELQQGDPSLGTILGAQIELCVYMFVAIGAISMVKTVINDAVVGHG